MGVINVTSLEKSSLSRAMNVRLGSLTLFTDGASLKTVRFHFAKRRKHIKIVYVTKGIINDCYYFVAPHDYDFICAEKTTNARKAYKKHEFQYLCIICESCLGFRRFLRLATSFNKHAMMIE